jgi:hypothetical protein
MSFISVYDIWLAPHETFLFYESDSGDLLSTANLDKPFVRIPNNIWDSKTKDFEPTQDPDRRITMWAPTWGVRKEDLDEHLPHQLMAAAKKTYSTLNLDTFPIFVAQKELPCGLIEIGILCPKLHSSHSNYPHNKWENSVNRYMRLKAFW